MSWTTPTDVTAAWIGEGKPTETTLIQVWIDKAERALRRHVPDLQDRIDAEAEDDKTDLLQTARDSVVSMVTRVFRNPEGIRQTNVTTGPFSGTKTYGGTTPGGLEPTDDELAGLVTYVTGRAYTIDTIPTTSPYSPHYLGL
jgi:hypothetical protein